MKYTAKEVLQYVEENDVKFVKLTFCDLFGRQKNVSIVSQQLPAVFENGYLFNSSAVPGYTDCSGDLLLQPDPRTFSVLPWRPQMGAVISLLTYLKYPNGSFYEGDALHLLDIATQKLHKLGLSCEIATDCEFYVFKLDGDGNPTSVPIDRAGYLDCAPYDECENIRRDIVLSLEDMGIVPTASHHEEGPGQNEIDFMQTEPSSAARNFLYFKSAVKNVSRINGVQASFAPKPLPDSVGSGLRITLTLGSIGDKAASPTALKSFTDGILNKLGDITVFLNSTQDSYKLLTERRAPVLDSRSDRASCVRVFGTQDGKCKVEINSADCLCNPFLAFALLLEAGLYGIKNEAKTNVKVDLPHTLDDAITRARESEWLSGVLSPQLITEYLRLLKSVKSDYALNQ